MNAAMPEDFVYMDPPYIGRHTDYYNNWINEDAIELAKVSATLECGFALSMWKQNKFRENSHLDLHWNGFVTKTFHISTMSAQKKNSATKLSKP